MFQRPHARSAQAVTKPARFLRLPGRFAVAQAAHEALQPDLPWLPSQWKWHLGTQFLILRGGPPTQTPGGELTSGADRDAPVLARMPAVKALLDKALPARARVAWIGRSPPGARICLHVDNTPFWDEHHRVHLPLVTDPAARLAVAGRFAHFPAGEAWAFNNSKVHGALNDGPAPRLHLLVDLPDTAAVRAWLAAGEAVDGAADPGAWAALAVDPLVRLTDAQRADAPLMARLRAQ
ncbi:MAG: aspartyl/asparaginyl beta-hydroxylase domain-containing protein [Myxococcales bacterium]|nr:aspartyl/asparaginyl beta-hydroxylase domain-containing protein [Myxococcales bacterium]MCB9525962.1 aspartyl/asparaginyl beta-hydroxylase domain-containing protein [Myxococcales bacterium]